MATFARTVKSAAKQVIYRLPPNRINFGSLRRLHPVSNVFGYDRGRPIDRYYIESFLREHASLTHGHVLEVGDDSYSRQFGADKIQKQDVLHVVPEFPGATIIADIAHAPQIPSDTFDCIIFTQTLQYVFDPHAGISTLWRILKAGGTVLATVPGMSRILRDQADKESDCWRFTEYSIKRLFAESFGSEFMVQTYGNVLSAIAFMEGLATFELRKEELEYHDPDYQIVIAVRATKKLPA
jgi:SAM-dependent methyltransferase